MKDRIDLTQGSISKAMFRLALPIMGSAFLSMAYNLYDMFTVGHIEGISGLAVAAVGTGGFYLMLSAALALLTRVGAEVRVSQSLGAYREDRAEHFAAATLQLQFVLSLSYALIVFLLRAPLISFFQISDPKVVALANNYLSIVIWSVPVTNCLMVLTGIFTGGGLSRIPFIASIGGLITKLVMNYVFVSVLFLDVKGVALATVMAQSVSLGILLISKELHTEGYLKFPLLKPVQKSFYTDVLRLGAPAAIQSFVYTLIAMYIGRLVASFGSDAIGVQRLGAQIESISWMTANGFGTAMSAFIGQNYGARALDRLRKGYLVGAAMVGSIGLLATALLMIFPRQLFSLFIADPTIARMGIDYLIIVGISQFFQTLEISTNGAFNGLGLTKFPSVLGISLQVFRIPGALILMRTSLGLSGIWWAISFSTVLKGILGVSLFYFVVLRPLKIHGRLRFEGVK